ncbi:sulfurtransferase [Aureococcus anophagefferens]|nr:sulfurtransferase [Aureococcus anophagefferens]
MAPARRSASSTGWPNDDVENLRSRGFASVAADLSHAAALRAAGGFFEQIAPIKALAVAPRYLAATRGYVGAFTENYSSLGGVAGRPNDDVEKFRLGVWLPFDGTPAPDLGNAWPSSAPGFDGAAFRDDRAPRPTSGTPGRRRRRASTARPSATARRFGADLASGGRIVSMTYKTWRLSRVRRAMATAKAGARGKASAPRPRAKAAARPRPNSSTSPRVESSFFCADEARVAPPRGPSPADLAPPLALTAEQVERFKVDGFLVVPNVLDASGLAAARRGLEASLARYGVDASDPATFDGLRRLSSTNGAGGVLDLFYERWKLELSLETVKFADAYRDLLAATYATGDPLWSHPYGDDWDPSELWAHVDRIGCRIPEAGEAGETGADGKQKAGKKKRIQRSLAPHLDCAGRCAGGGKAFPRRRLSVAQPDFWIHGPSSGDATPPDHEARGLGPRARMLTGLKLPRTRRDWPG